MDFIPMALRKILAKAKGTVSQEFEIFLADDCQRKMATAASSVCRCSGSPVIAS